jgi:hypothetical protein
MTFFWFIEPWRALLGKQRNNAKTSQPAGLADAFADWAKANPKQRQAAGRIHGALVQAGLFKTLQDLQVPDEELLNVQGIGPYGLRVIRQIGGRYAED